MKLPEELSGAYEISFKDYPIPKNWQVIFKENATKEIALKAISKKNQIYSNDITYSCFSLLIGLFR